MVSLKTIISTNVETGNCSEIMLNLFYPIQFRGIIVFDEEKLKEKAKDTLSGIFNKIPSVTIEELAAGAPGPLVAPDIVYGVRTEDVSRYMFVVTRTSGQLK